MADTKTVADVPRHIFRPVETKQVLVRFVDKNAPEYIFQGEWSGRDILVVMKTIVRAHRRQNLARRRKALSDQTEMSPATGGNNG